MLLCLFTFLNKTLHPLDLCTYSILDSADKIDTIQNTYLISAFKKTRVHNYLLSNFIYCWFIFLIVLNTKIYHMSHSQKILYFNFRHFDRLNNEYRFTARMIP